MNPPVQTIYAYVKIGRQHIPCVAFDLQYNINTIPTATAALAVGIDQFGEPSSVHAIPEMPFLSASIIVIENVGTKDEREVTVFEGYLIGIAYSKQMGRFSATVNLVHWMIDLTYSVLAISEEHLGGGGDGHLPAVILDEDFGFADGPSFLGEYQTAGAFRDAMHDIGSALIGVCKQMSKKVPIRIPGRCDFDPQENTLVVNALKRVATSGGIGRGGVQGYTGAVPAVLTVEESGDVVADGLATWTKKYITTAFFAANLWDKLISTFAPALQLLVVPTVKHMLLVPYTPCLRQVGIHLSLSEVAALDIQGMYSRPIRSVGMLSGGASMFAAFGNAETVRTLGCYKGPVEKGVAMYVDVPGWLSGLPILSAPAPRADDDVPTATTPDADVPQEEAPDWTSFYDRMAQSVYYQELFRGRTLAVMTNFRYDIAPGTIVQLDSVVGAFGASEAQPGLVGTVQSVQIFFDAEAPRCGTQLRLGYLRTVSENKKMGIDRHPLYAGDAFTGAVLYTDRAEIADQDAEPAAAEEEESDLGE